MLLLFVMLMCRVFVCLYIMLKVSGIVMVKLFICVLSILFELFMNSEGLVFL